MGSTEFQGIEISKYISELTDNLWSYQASSFKIVKVHLKKLYGRL